MIGRAVAGRWEVGAVWDSDVIPELAWADWG